MITAEYRERSAKARKEKPKPTIKQKKAVALIVENGGNVSKAMRDAGYTEATAKTPSKLTNSYGYKVEARTVLERYEVIRNKILSALEERDLTKSETFTLASALKGITHDIQLLSGNRTENVGIEHERETLQAVLVQMRSK